MEKLNITFSAREVLTHEKLQRIPTKVDEIIDGMNDMMAEVFPLTAAYISNNSGSTEVGESVTPTVAFSITRKGVNVSDSAEVSVIRTNGDSGIATLNSGKTRYVADSIREGSVGYKVSITQGGQTIELPTLTWNKTYYRYKGTIDAIPEDYAVAIKSLSKELSTTPTLGSTGLSANKYYLFAVKGTHSLVCRHASTEGVINGCVTGIVQIGLECDNSILNTYSYILVPASSSTWNFKITNS